MSCFPDTTDMVVSLEKVVAGVTVKLMEEENEVNVSGGKRKVNKKLLMTKVTRD